MRVAITKKIRITSLIVLLFLVVGYVIWSWTLSNVEHPQYEVLSANGAIELRRYNPMFVAEVHVKGQREEAIRKGFKLLADYIFGNNTMRRKISMTAPVQQQESQKTTMAAPVTQQVQADQWAVQFIMPSEYSFKQLPIPNNNEVKLRSVAAKTVAVIRFSGKSTTENIESHEQQLDAYLRQRDFTILSMPYYAFYNPPWTLAFMRRNEVMIEVGN